MSQNSSKRARILLLAILACFAALSAYYLSQVWLSGDGGFQSSFMRDFSRQQTITGMSDHLWGVYGFPRFQQYTLNYPAIYHTLGTVLYPVLDYRTVFVIDLSLLLMLALTAYTIVLKKTRDKSRANLVMGMLLFSGLFISGGNNNLYFSAFAVLSVLQILKTRDRPNIANAILLVIFMTAGFGAKQFFIFVYPALFGLQSYYAFRRKYSWRYLASITACVVLLVAPIIGFQIKTTGTISTQTIEGWPVVDRVLQPRHIIDIPEWQKEIDKIVNIESLREESARHYDAVNTKLHDAISDPYGALQRWADPNGYSLLPLSLRTQILSSLFIAMLALAVVAYSKTKKRKLESSLIALTIFLPFLFIMQFTRRIEYALFFPILITIFLASYVPLGKGLNKILIVEAIIAMSLYATFSYTANILYFFNNNYMRSGVSHDELQALYSWEKANVKNDDKVFTANTQDDPYYTDKKSFYDYRLWFLNNGQLHKYLPDYTGLKYIVIFEPNISPTFDNWNIIPSDSPLLNDITNTHKITKTVYQSESFTIAEVIPQ